MKRSLWFLVSVCVLCFLAACGGGSGGNDNNIGGGVIGGNGNGSGASPRASFTATGSMTFAREGQTATLLGDGRVLITGGKNASGELATTEIFDPATGAFSPTGSMEIARIGQTATRLNDGRVLITGGKNTSGDLATAETFDPARGMFAPTGTMANARVGHTATLLNDGRVLVAGGGTATAELFDSKTGQFTPAGDMVASRIYHAATLLLKGEVLIAGGTDSSGTALGELFDPATTSFTPTATGGTQALNLAATLLQDGRVFLAGGEVTVMISGGSTRCCISGPVSVSLATLFDSSSMGFSAAGDMSASRASLTTTLLSRGDVLIAGGATITTKAVGASAITTVQPLASAELFNPVSRTFAPTGSMRTARAGHTATLLGNGKVLVAGGIDTNGNALASAELYQ